MYRMGKEDREMTDESLNEIAHLYRHSTRVRWIVAEVKRLRMALEAAQKDTERLDRLEAECLTGNVGNGICIMPVITTATGGITWSLGPMEDYDPCDEIADSKATLRETIDEMRAE